MAPWKIFCGSHNRGGDYGTQSSVMVACMWTNVTCVKTLKHCPARAPEIQTAKLQSTLSTREQLKLCLLNLFKPFVCHIMEDKGEKSMILNS